MSANAQQIEYWNGPAGERWANAQDRIDHHLGLITDALLAFAEPKEGERILDIGCGGGTTALMLRERVGPNGAVTGIDISGPILAVAKARAHAGMADLALVQADAATYDFQPVFDLAFSRFGVMFFDDPAAALANIRTALVRTGRFVFVCWRAFKENDWSFVPYQAALKLLPPQEPADPHAPGPFAFADGERVRDLLSKAGYRDIAVKPHDTTVDLGATLDEAVVESLTIGPLARATVELDEPTRDKIRAAVRIELAKHQTAYGIILPAAVWLVRAQV